jgi:hypothetical protein
VGEWKQCESWHQGKGGLGYLWDREWVCEGGAIWMMRVCIEEEWIFVGQLSFFLLGHFNWAYGTYLNVTLLSFRILLCSKSLVGIFHFWVNAFCFSFIFYLVRNCHFIFLFAVYCWRFVYEIYKSKFFLLLTKFSSSKNDKKKHYNWCLKIETVKVESINFISIFVDWLNQVDELPWNDDCFV